MTLDPIYIALGACVGFIVGLTGVGGGSLMTPALVLLFGIHPATAVGTDLLYAATTKSVGSLVHGLRRNVAWRVVGLLALGSVPASAVTLFGLAQLGPHSGLMTRTITCALGIALLLTSVSLVFRRVLMAMRQAGAGRSAERTATLTVLTGAVIGVLVSISSVGAGAIGVSALLLLYPSYSASRIVGTDIVHAVPLTLVAGLGHWLTGSVDVSMLVSLVSGSVPTIALGSYLAPRLPEVGLRYLLALVLAIAGGKLVMA
ncbi:MAG: sulfite exporter TauE/SafE family protein [Proteobacteria bacterium]|nr:sulfite exporter TauE/SafE family protein [Pseudomonadota bacterium]